MNNTKYLPDMIFGHIFGDSFTGSLFRYKLQKIVNGASSVIKRISGTSPLTIMDAKKGKIKSLIQYGKVDVVENSPNLWDEIWETGSYGMFDGEKYDNQNAIRSKNFFSVSDSQEYFIAEFTEYTNVSLYIGFWDDNGFIESAIASDYFGTGDDVPEGSQAASLTPPSGATKAKLWSIGGQDGGVYHNNICVNLVGEYAYHPSDGTIICNNGILSHRNGEIITIGTPEKITVSGRNLLYIPDKDQVDGYGMSLYTEDECVYISGTTTEGFLPSVGATLPIISIENPFRIAPGEYTLSISGDNLGLLQYSIRRVSGFPAVVAWVDYSKPSATFSLTKEEQCYIMATTYSAGVDASAKFNMQIESGNGTHRWMPYVVPQTANASNLYAVGNICDEQDLIGGKVFRNTEACIYDSNNPPSVEFVGVPIDGKIIIKVLNPMRIENVQPQPMTIDSDISLINWSSEVSGKTMEVAYKEKHGADNSVVGTAIVGVAKAIGTTIGTARIDSTTIGA